MVGTTGDTPAMSAVMLATAILGLGFGIHQAAVYALTLRGVPNEHTGATSAALTVSQTLGTMLSIALMTSILSWQQSSNGATFVEAYRFTYFIAAGVALLSGLILLRLRRGKA